MQIVVPMAGAGARFLRAGYKTIKPLIEVEGAPIIEHVVRMFPGEEDFLFICSREHLEETPLRSVLERLVPGALIAGIEPHKLGPVHTALEARELIRDEGPVILNYCDFSAHWDYAEFKRRLKELDCAGCITAYRGFHPHSLGPNLYAYMRERDNFLLEIQEKHCFTDDRRNEFASAGGYYFRSGELLKRYFQHAVDQDLQTNGEFYASMPYNLVVEDGLDVYIYELEYFLQWGTPEDLEEYLGWSRYFASGMRQTPGPKPMLCVNLVPMAGAGARFRQEGYTEPKPLIPVADIPMIRRSLDSLPPAKDWIAVCRKEHLENASLMPTLSADRRKVRVVSVDELTEGQASTCLLARDFLEPTKPLLIAPCDTSMTYDGGRYTALTADPDIDCLVWTFRDHPHANRNPAGYGWAETTSHGDIRRISCKTPLGEDVRNDAGITGAFWFREARFFLEAADALIAQDRRTNNEFYVDAAIQVLLEQGRRAKVFDVEHYISYGNPDDVRTYEYWDSYFKKGSRHP